VRTEPASVQIIRPDARQISRFRELGFGDSVSEPAYRPVPTRQRYGAYADPFYYYYYDPYYDFMSWVLVDSMIHSAWHPGYVHVVDPGGAFLYSGDQAVNYANDGWVGYGAWPAPKTVACRSLRRSRRAPATRWRAAPSGAAAATCRAAAAVRATTFRGRRSANSSGDDSSSSSSSSCSSRLVVVV
jgi:hypothetical protein